MAFWQARSACPGAPHDIAGTGRAPAGFRAAAFFDLDKTIIAGSSVLAFSRPFRRQGLISRRAALRSGYTQLLLLLSGADADTMDLLRRRITALCTGWEVAQIRAIVAETLHEIVEPLVYAEATELIAEHRANGDEVVVLSASGLEVVEPIAALVGADRCRGHPDGRRGRPLHRCDRVLLLRRGEGRRPPGEIAAERGYRLADCRAYSDSITDLPLLEAVGHPTVVNPDRALRRVAAGARLAGADASSTRWRCALASARSRRARSRSAACGAAAAWLGGRAGTGLTVAEAQRSIVRLVAVSAVDRHPPCLNRCTDCAALLWLRVTDYKEAHGLLIGQGRCGREAPVHPDRAPCAKVGHSTHSTPREACRRGPAYRDAGRRGHNHDT